MKGNTLNEFIDTLYMNCDKEISFHGQRDLSGIILCYGCRQKCLRFCF